jgi:hypothetical protein
MKQSTVMLLLVLAFACQSATAQTPCAWSATQGGVAWGTAGTDVARFTTVPANEVWIVRGAAVSTQLGGYSFAIEIEHPTGFQTGVEEMKTNNVNPVRTLQRKLVLFPGEIIRARSCCGNSGQIGIAVTYQKTDLTCFMANYAPVP